MRKFLPKSINNPQGFTTHQSVHGFTLVELLVVISIIAILSVIGITVFTGVQKNAREAKRKGDIEAIAKAMEVNYDETTGKYKDFDATFMAGGTYPSDPMSGTSKCGTESTNFCEYCAGTSTMAAGENGALACIANGAKVAKKKPEAGTTFRVCATLENAPYYYCRSNQR